MATFDGFSDYVANLVARWLFLGEGPPSLPATVYLAAFTLAPTSAGGGVEVDPAGTGYARVPMSTATDFAVSGPPVQASNVSDVAFPIASAPWGTIVAVALFDAATAGNMLERWTEDPAGNPLSVPINTNEILRAKAGVLSLAVS